MPIVDVIDTFENNFLIFHFIKANHHFLALRWFPMFHIPMAEIDFHF